MKICILSTYDSGGGAFIAARRLHKSLIKIGVNSTMLVKEKITDDETIISFCNNKLEKGLNKLIPTLDSLPLQFYPNRDSTPFSIQWIPDRLLGKVSSLAPDIINLHWVSLGYLQIETIPKFKKPILWTLHDMFPFTGGCHCSGDCVKYTKQCGSCPILQSNNNWDLSYWVFQRKAKAWRNLNLTIVTPSKWLANVAKSSSLFKDYRIEIIPHGIDTKIYKPINRKIAREILNLPQDKQIIAFVAINAIKNPLKGFQILQAALQGLSNNLEWKNNDNVEIIVVGSSEPKIKINLGFLCRYLGKIQDDLGLVIAYSAANLTVVPSKQEAFCMTAFESLACGTPVVAFHTSGLTDIVDHQVNGYLAKPFDVEDLARGIAWVLDDQERYLKLCKNARKKVVENFDEELQAKHYYSLLAELIEQKT